MSSLDLSWSKLYLACTEIVWDSEEVDALRVVQWYTTSSTLMIVKEVGEESLTIELRGDTDVESVEYDRPDKSRSNAVVALTIIPSRPFPWAENTTFDPVHPTNNRVVLQVDLTDNEDHEKYEGLTAWLKLHQNTGGAKVFAEGEAEKILEELATGVMMIEDDGVGTGSDGVPKKFLQNRGGRIGDEEMQRLEPGEWANEELVSFGLEWARNLEDQPPARRGGFIYHTQFYTKFKKEGYESILKWMKKWPLHVHDYCLFPTNINNVHWILVIVDNAKCLAAKNGEGAGHGVTSVYVLDSLKSQKTDSEVAHDFKSCLEFIYKTDEHHPEVVTYVPTVPQQDDGSACGFWTIHFGRMFMERPEYYRALISSGKEYDRDKCWRKSEGLKVRSSLRDYIKTEMAKR